jgi:hypothetical protein
MSERASTALYDAVQKDRGIDLAENPDQILTKSRVHQEMSKFTKGLSKKKQPNSPANYFDGKTYPTMRNETFAEMKRRNVVEDKDHYVVTDSFRESFVEKFSPPTGTGNELGKGIIETLQSKGIDVDEMFILGGDSTAANTGR